MAFADFKRLFTRPSKPFLAGLIMVFLVSGLSFTVIVLQEQQEARSRAAVEGGIPPIITSATCYAACVAPIPGGVIGMPRSAFCFSCVQAGKISCLAGPAICVKGASPIFMSDIPACVLLASKCGINPAEWVKNRTGGSGGSASVKCSEIANIQGVRVFNSKTTCSSSEFPVPNYYCLDSRGKSVPKYLCVSKSIGTSIAGAINCVFSKHGKCQSASSCSGTALKNVCGSGLVCCVPKACTPGTKDCKCLSTGKCNSGLSCKGGICKPTTTTITTSGGGGGATEECNRDGCCSNPKKGGYAGGKCQYTDRGIPCPGGYVPTNVWLCPRGSNYRCCKPATGATTFALTLCIHGIGKAGDSVNPGPSGGGNTDPVNKQRTISFDLLHPNDQAVVQDKPVTVNYDSDSGCFKGTVSLSGLTTKTYKLKPKMTQSLRASVTRDIESAKPNTIPSTALITGDINKDNHVNLADYPILTGCISEFGETPPNCPDADKKLQSDLTDDGNVNAPDVNLFIRELSDIAGN